MKNALKGALLSGLVLPGLGQLVLRQYWRGVTIVLAVLIILTRIIVIAVQNAMVVLDNIELQGGVVDMAKISEIAARESAVHGSPIFNVLLIFLAACWILATVDAYRIGRKMDLGQPLPGQNRGN